MLPLSPEAALGIEKPYGRDGEGGRWLSAAHPRLATRDGPLEYQSLSPSMCEVKGVVRCECIVNGAAVQYKPSLGVFEESEHVGGAERTLLYPQRRPATHQITPKAPPPQSNLFVSERVLVWNAPPLSQPNLLPFLPCGVWLMSPSGSEERSVLVPILEATFSRGTNRAHGAKVPRLFCLS